MAFGYRYPVTIDHTKVGGSDLTDFPVGFIGTYSWCATVANGGRAQHANGYDAAIPFSDTGLTSGLDYELASYNATTGQIERYCRQPTLSSSVDDVVQMAIGDASIVADGSSSSTWNAGFLGVYHFGTHNTLSVLNSAQSGSSNDLTNVGGSQAAGAVAGGAISFNGTSNYAWKSSGPVVNALPLTISMLANPDAVTAQRTMACVTDKDTPTTNTILLFKMNTAIYRAALAGANVNTAATFTAGVWSYVGLRYISQTSAVAYLDNNATSGSPTNALNAGIDSFTVGANSGNGTQVGFFDGDADEVRVSNVDRGAGWMACEYNNLLSPGTFYSVGSEVAVNNAAPSPRRVIQTSGSAHARRVDSRSQVVRAASRTTLTVVARRVIAPATRAVAPIETRSRTFAPRAGIQPAPVSAIVRRVIANGLAAEAMRFTLGRWTSRIFAPRAGTAAAPSPAVARRTITATWSQRLSWPWRTTIASPQAGRAIAPRRVVQSTLANPVQAPVVSSRVVRPEHGYIPTTGIRHTVAVLAAPVRWIRAISRLFRPRAGSTIVAPTIIPPSWFVADPIETTFTVDAIETTFTADAMQTTFTPDEP